MCAAWSCHRRLLEANPHMPYAHALRVPPLFSKQLQWIDWSYILLRRCGRWRRNLERRYSAEIGWCSSVAEGCTAPAMCRYSTLHLDSETRRTFPLLSNTRKHVESYTRPIVTGLHGSCAGCQGSPAPTNSTLRQLMGRNSAPLKKIVDDISVIDRPLRTVCLWHWQWWLNWYVNDHFSSSCQGDEERSHSHCGTWGSGV